MYYIFQTEKKKYLTSVSHLNSEALVEKGTRKQFHRPKPKDVVNRKWNKTKTEKHIELKMKYIKKKYLSSVSHE